MSGRIFVAFADGRHTQGRFLSVSLTSSADGVSWTDLWRTGPFHVSDSSWQLVEYAVPAGIADGRPTVYFRWGLGPTDDWVTYPGWNIDDLQVTGERL